MIRSYFAVFVCYWQLKIKVCILAIKLVSFCDGCIYLFISIVMLVDINVVIISSNLQLGYGNIIWKSDETLDFFIFKCQTRYSFTSFLFVNGMCNLDEMFNAIYAPP